MANENSNARALDWDDEIENDGQEGGFALLPKGDYPFRVVKMERKQYQPTSAASKIGACKMAVLSIEVDGGDYGTAFLSENLHLWGTMEWKLCQFFRAIGGRKHGERVKMDWSTVVGSEGRCAVSVRKYKKRDDPEGTMTGEANQIDKFLDPADAPKPTMPAESDLPPNW